MKAVYCHPAYLQYIMRKVGLDKAQVGIKIAWRNINNLTYVDDTTRKRRGPKEPLDESESENAGLKLNIQKPKIMTCGPIT